MTRLWVRADASADAGLGHVMRSLSVAQAARRRGLDVTFVVAPDPVGSTLPGRFGFDVREPDGWAAAIEPGDAVLFDGYHFGAGDFAAARARGARVGAVDDFGSGEFDVDVVVNPNPDDALVREEFRARRRVRSGRTGTLLVTLGGSDAAGLGPRVVELLGNRPPFDTVLFVRGPAAPPLPDRPPWLELVPDPADVAATFDRADAAVTAAGSTTWELLCLGVPTAIVQVADNQQQIVRAATQHGAAVFLGDPAALDRTLPAAVVELADADRQRELSTRAMDLVDGRGPDRVLDALLSRSGPS